MNVKHKRRKPTNSKKGTIAVCKAPKKENPNGVCGNKYVVNKDRVKDHKYCSNACKSRAGYHKQKKEKSRIQKEIKRHGAKDEVQLSEIKDGLKLLKVIDKDLETILTNLYFGKHESALMDLRILVEDLLALSVASLSMPIKFRQTLGITKKKALEDKHVVKYLKKKSKMEREGASQDWILMKMSIPNYHPLYLIDLLEKV